MPSPVLGERKKNTEYSPCVPATFCLFNPAWVPRQVGRQRRTFSHRETCEGGRRCASCRQSETSRCSIASLSLTGLRSGCWQFAACRRTHRSDWLSRPTCHTLTHTHTHACVQAYKRIHTAYKQEFHVTEFLSSAPQPSFLIHPGTTSRITSSLRLSAPTASRLPPSSPPPPSEINT